MTIAGGNGNPRNLAGIALPAVLERVMGLGKHYS
jgi:hypothetical protein